MEDSDTSLLCQETESSLNRAEGDDGDDDKENIGSVPVPIHVFEDEDEYVENLIRREALHELEASVLCLSHFRHSVESTAWWRHARLDSIEWILSDGKLWAIRLMSVACLSLAAKMEECDVPALSGFPTQKYEFESRVIRRMELLILHTLDWKMGSITPFAYLNFFIHKLLGRSGGMDLFTGAVELIFLASKEINLVDYRPSTIAAAAVLASSSSAQLTGKAVELKTGVISSWGSQHYEHVISSYNLMQEIKRKGKNKTPRGRLFPSSMCAFRNSPPLTPEVGGLKRRLQFNSDSDRNLPLKKANKQ
ncbi:cyclin-D5-1 isoform X2 [Punica granatum]|uniref:Cyclin-D5-1 isoform X2 n=1 Tax=Punica granatum TaxID=22663 RepID=A0A6P8D0J6_PUNGR|nr:cyclin-D5-1 isoform X2 [Punica granatum]